MIKNSQKLKKTLVVTGADHNHQGLVEDFVISFREMYREACKVAFINFSNRPLSAVIQNNFDIIIALSDGYDNFDTKNGYYSAYSRAKSRLRELFHGFEYYCWIDADCWFHTSESLARIIEYADVFDICIHPEYDIHYWRHPTPNPRTLFIYGLNERVDISEDLVKMPMVNAGVFAMNAGSIVWKEWDDALNNLRQRFDAGEAVYLSDQIPLHKLIYTNNIDIFPLQAIDNWQTYASIPSILFDKQLKQLKLTPQTPPFDQIGIIHLAGYTKDLKFKYHEGYEFTFRYRDIKKLMECLGLV